MNLYLQVQVGSGRDASHLVLHHSGPPSPQRSSHQVPTTTWCLREARRKEQVTEPDPKELPQALEGALHTSALLSTTTPLAVLHQDEDKETLKTKEKLTHIHHFLVAGSPCT